MKIIKDPKAGSTIYKVEKTGANKKPKTQEGNDVKQK